MLVENIENSSVFIVIFINYFLGCWTKTNLKRTIWIVRIRVTCLLSAQFLEKSKSFSDLWRREGVIFSVESASRTSILCHNT